MSGDIAAIKEIQDTVHGKITDIAEYQHSYTQMGYVTVDAGDGVRRRLTFDVGSEVNPV